MKSLKERIAVMQYYANGGEVEIFTNGKWGNVTNDGFLNWNFAKYDFRIKEQKKTVIIYKWLMLAGDRKSYFIIEGNSDFFEDYYTEDNKIKLLDTYEVEI